MKPFQQAISDALVLLDVHASDPRTVFEIAVNRAAEAGRLLPRQREAVLAELLRREELASTAIGHSVAIPHAYLEGLEEPVVIFVRLEKPINLDAPDGVPTRFFFILLGPPGYAAEHLDTLLGIARLMSDDEFRFDAGIARDHAEYLDSLARYQQRRELPATPEAAEIPAGLQYTGRLFGGLLGDIRRRRPHYASDFRDGLHAKSIAATLFLFFACLAPAVTFGGLMAALTNQEIGAVEMIVATAICGVVYVLFSGQPLIILGGTGPLLVFTAILFQLCSDLGIPFLPTYAWVGLWTGILMLILAATDASALMSYFTRFTDEIFAALISVIYVYESVHALIAVFHDADQNLSHDIALLSLLLALGTFYFAHTLSRFRRSRYLLPQIREFLSDFGPMIAIVSMTGIAVWLHEVQLEVLNVPDTLATTSGRAWLVDPWAAPVWVRFAAIGPAILAALLVFLDQNITARIINDSEHHLQKGEAYHLDLAVVGGLIAACSLFGLPWLVAATVRSLNHVRALATVEEVIGPGEERHDKIIHVRENRITGLAIHLLVAVSLLLLPLLRTIPMAVLYGLFLYMGIVSMSGNQFFERLKLWLMDPRLYPTTHYIRRVPQATIHKFTLLQVGCLAVLWIVKVSALGILFPLFVALLVPVRILAGKFFSQQHLKFLDADEQPEEEGTDWAAG